MKNSKDYGAKIDKLFKSLKKGGGAVKPVAYKEPVDAVVYAFVSAFTTEANAAKIIKRINSHFVDVNDLRVSRPEEIVEVFGEMTDAAAASAEAMTTALNAIFEKYDKVSLEALCGEGKRQARKDLEQLAGITPFVAAYTTLTALGGHAIPLTDRMVDYLKQNELVDVEAAIQDIEGFLERHISAADAYSFYALLRAEAEASKKNAAGSAKSKPAAKAASKKPAVKKKSAKQ